MVNPTTISNLPAATSPLSGAEYIPIVQNGITVRTTAANFASIVATDTIAAGNGIAASTTAGVTTVSLAPLSSADILVGNASNVAAAVALSGDATLANNGALTLGTVNSNVGSFTNTSITVNAKGLVTAASSGTLGIYTVHEQIFTSTNTYTPTAGMLYAIVEVLGAGGGGGGTT